MRGCQLLDNQWALLADESAAELEELFRGFVDRNDRIVIVKAGKDWASRHGFSGSRFSANAFPAPSSIGGGRKPER